MSRFTFWPLSQKAEEEAARLRAELAGLALLRAGHQLAALAAKANFNRAEPRVPAGNPGGGRWTDGGGDAGYVRVAANDRSSTATDVERGIILLPKIIPPSANLDENIRQSESVRALLSPEESILWFYSQVHNGGPWDYKKKARKYADFGNFNYGATGAALGISDATLLRMAGWAQTRSGNTGSGISPGLLDSLLGMGGQSPFGDDAADQVFIKRGIEYYKEKNGRP
jgi:hypothetical protein